MIDKAYQLASEHHKHQMYGDKPYVYHLRSVYIKCLDQYSGLSIEDVRSVGAVAFLHDILEDTSCEYETIGHACGWKVADAVVSVTKVKGESYKDYIKKVKSDDIALKVKIADTLCNLEESVKIRDMKRIKKYTKQLELLCED